MPAESFVGAFVELGAELGARLDPDMVGGKPQHSAGWLRPAYQFQRAS